MTDTHLQTQYKLIDRSMDQRHTTPQPYICATWMYLNTTICISCEATV
jgi:hypothetical protein